MAIATVTTKGQVTIPAEVREALGLRVGSRLHFVPLPDGNYEIVPATRTVRDLAGFLAPTPVALSVEEMDDGVASGFTAPIDTESTPL